MSQTGTPGRRRARRSGALLAIAAIAVPMACGDTEEQALCPAYEDFLDARAAVAEVDPLDASAAEATEIVEEYLAVVHQLEQQADGRYATELDALDTAVSDVLVTLSSVQDTADYATWAPLVEDSLEDVRNAAIRVEQVIEPSCSPDTPDTSEPPETSEA